MNAGRIVRGSIYWVAFPDRSPRGAEIEKTRPCVCLSLDSINAVRRTVIVVPLTTSPKTAAPIALPVPSAGKDSVAVCDQVQVVDKHRIRGEVGHLASHEIEAIENSVRTILGL